MMIQSLTAGQKAPDFNLPRDTLDAAQGNSLKLADFAGHKLVLYFYPKDDTSGCTKEAIEFNALKADFSATDTQIVGISADSVASHNKFKTKYDLAFPLISDEKHEMLTAYGVWVEKSMYGRKYMGIERTTVLVNRDGTIAEIWSKVKVPGHAAAVLEAARNLG
jgi:peroxiredoxin Q/BCP